MPENEHNNSGMEREGKVVTGIVTEALPNTLFKVQIGEDTEFLAYLSGKMRLHRIKVLIGDKVEVFIDGYGGRGRIIKRL